MEDFSDSPRRAQFLWTSGLASAHPYVAKFISAIMRNTSQGWILQPLVVSGTTVPISKRVRSQLKTAPPSEVLHGFDGWCIWNRPCTCFTYFCINSKHIQIVPERSSPKRRFFAFQVLEEKSKAFYLFLLQIYRLLFPCSIVHCFYCKRLQDKNVKKDGIGADVREYQGNM